MNLTMYISFSSIIVLLFAFLAMTLPYTLGGLRIMLAKFKFKQNTGLIFLKNKSGNIPMPLPCDLRESEFVFKLNKIEYRYPLSRDAFEDNGRFFGLPYCIYDQEDAKNTIGLYYQSSDKNGEPLYYDEHNAIPVLKKIKHAVTIAPSFIKALISEQSLTRALKELFDKNQLLLYVMIGNGLIALGAGYFVFEIHSILPEIIGKLDSIISAMNTK